MLTAATLGMALYGVYSVLVGSARTYAARFGVVDAAMRPRIEVAASLAEIVFGLLLLLSAAFVRVVMPGGLALAIGALLGLQALSIHADVHLTGSVALTSQFARAGIAALLVGLAYFGARAERERVKTKADS